MYNYCHRGKWFEPRGIIYLFGVIVRVKVVFRKTLHLTLKMTTVQVVETSVTNNSLSKDYPHPDDHAKQINKYTQLTLIFILFFVLSTALGVINL